MAKHIQYAKYNLNTHKANATNHTIIKSNGIDHHLGEIRISHL